MDEQEVDEAYLRFGVSAVNSMQKTAEPILNYANTIVEGLNRVSPLGLAQGILQNMQTFSAVNPPYQLPSFPEWNREPEGERDQDREVDTEQEEETRPWGSNPRQYSARSAY